MPSAARLRIATARSPTCLLPLEGRRLCFERLLHFPHQPRQRILLRLHLGQLGLQLRNLAVLAGQPCSGRVGAAGVESDSEQWRLRRQDSQTAENAAAAAGLRRSEHET